MRLARLALVGVLFLTVSAARAGALYPRAQTVKVPPPTRAVAAKPATPAPFTGISVIDLIGPPGFTVPPAPGEIAQLVTNVSRAPGQPDPLFELASAYGRQMRAHQTSAAAHGARAAATTDATLKAQATRDMTHELQQSKAMLLNAVKMFRSFVDDPANASYARADEALFVYGFVLQSGKYMKEARTVFDRLLKGYPASAHVPNAHLVFAEYYLESNQLADGEARLRYVLKFPKSPAYWAAMYRMGFIHMQLQRYQEALETYFQVAMGTRGNAALATLAEAARRGFVAAYVQVGKPDKAYPAFQRVDAGRALEMLEWLADGYTQAGMSHHAHDVATELARHKPIPSACASAATAARTAAPSLAAAVVHIEGLLRVRQRLEAQKVMTSSVAAQCRADAIEIAGDAARALHIDGQKTNDPLAYGAAATLYRAYVETIPDAPDVTAMTLLGAEAAWSHADLRNAPEHWDLSAAMFGKVVAAAPRTGDAALAAVLAWKNALAAPVAYAAQAGSFDITALPATRPAVLPLDPRASGLVAAVDAYAATVANPDDEELVRGRFLAATLHRQVHDYDRAAAILVDLVPRLGRRGDHANRELAANLALETLARAKQLDRVLQVADGFAADKAFLDRAPALRRTIEYLRSHSLRRP